MIKKDVTYGDWRIVRHDDSKMEVYKNGELCPKSAPVLREIAEEVGLEVNPDWRTSQLGRNVIKAVEEKLGTSNDIKDIDSKETPTENKSGLKKFTIEIKVKGIHEIAYSAIDTDEYDVDELTEDDVWNFDMEYLTSYALGDEWEGPFELKVYDENGDVVYENDCFEDFKKLSPGEYEIYVEDGDIDADDELCKKVESLLEERHEEDMSLLEEGIYLLQITEAKWKVMKFDLEAETFDPEQLFFVWNPQLSGAYYDYFTDCNHVLYKDQFLEFYIDDEDDVCDDYGTTYRIAERNDNYFSLIRDIEE